MRCCNTFAKFEESRKEYSQIIKYGPSPASCELDSLKMIHMVQLHCLYNFLFTQKSGSRLYICKIYLVFLLHFDLLLHYLDSTFSEMYSMKNDVTFIAFIILNDKPFSKFTNVKTMIKITYI